MQPLLILFLLLAFAGRSIAYSGFHHPNIILESELQQQMEVNTDVLVVDLNGQRYVRQQQGVTFFVKLTVTGNICYFIVPAMGDFTTPQEKIMKTATGEICSLNYANLARFCSDDKELFAWLVDLIYPDRKLYRYLLLYNKRNPV